MILFGVIFTVDIIRPDDPFSRASSKQADWVPTKRLKLSKRKDWRKTEGGVCDDRGGGLETTHSKWCALLTKAQFEEFVSEYSLEAKSTMTMGSIGAPCPYGEWWHWVPAISFEAECSGEIIGAYVTPYVSKPKHHDPAKEMSNHNWCRLKAAILNRWGGWELGVHRAWTASTVPEARMAQREQQERAEKGAE